MHINLQFHEGLPVEIAGQAKVQFDIVGGIDVTLGQHLVVHKVIELAIQSVTNDLLRVPSQCSHVGTQLVRLRFQEHFQLISGQVVLSRCAYKNHTKGAVSMLLYRHVLSVNDKAHHSKRLGEWEARVEKSFRTGISGLSGKQAGQVQLAHRDHAVGINPEALAVIPWLLIIIFGSRIFPF